MTIVPSVCDYEGSIFCEGRENVFLSPFPTSPCVICVYIIFLVGHKTTCIGIVVKIPSLKTNQQLLQTVNYVTKSNHHTIS